MVERICPGLPADWLNAWLAAIGALVRVPELRLRWSDDPVPLAVLVAPGDADPARLLAEAWPTEEEVATLPIARHVDGHPELRGRPDVDAWVDRARWARPSPNGWTLTSFYTDLAWEHGAGQVVRASPFCAPGPGTVGTLHDRLCKAHAHAPPGEIGPALDGASVRRSGFGLGFDVRRATAASDKSDPAIDPWVEVLAFYGLALFPTRGDGIGRCQRGWSSSRRDATFRWISWGEALSVRGVDALLDAVRSGGLGAPLGCTGTWESVLYEAPGQERAIGYGARRVEGPWDRR